jgi:hypothetical protein
VPAGAVSLALIVTESSGKNGCVSTARLLIVSVDSLCYS